MVESPGTPRKHSTAVSPAIIPLLDSKDGLLDTLQNAPMCIHFVDSNGRIVWANQAELNFLGYAFDEYVGRDSRE